MVYRPDPVWESEELAENTFNETLTTLPYIGRFYGRNMRSYPEHAQPIKKLNDERKECRYTLSFYATISLFCGQLASMPIDHHPALTEWGASACSGK